MKKVLVTGASGLIGRHSLPYLKKKGFQIHGVTTSLPGRDLPEAHWHQADLLDPAQTASLLKQVQPTHLLHFAWYAVPGKYVASPENFRWVQGSLSLLQAFLDQGGKRAVIAGTCYEYDLNYGYCSEKTTPRTPSTLYGTCKHSLQLLAEAFAEKTGLSLAWGRIFFVYGPFQKLPCLVPSVMQSLLNKEQARCSHGNQVRDYLHVSDIGSAFASLLESNVQGPVNIASGNPVKLREIIYKIADRCQAKNLVQLGAIPASEQEPPLIVGDVRRLTNEVGWKPEYSLDDGLEETLQWWKTHGADQ